MASTAVYCISCGTQTTDSHGKVHCPSCGQEFEYTMVARVQEVLAYQRPIATPVRGVSRLCSLALTVSLFSCAFPLIGATAIGLAVAGLFRVRRTQEQGTGYATAALILSVVGTLVFLQLYFGLNRTRSTAVSLVCMSNLRTIGQSIMLYENADPGVRGYGLADLRQVYPPIALSCPAPDHVTSAPSAGGLATTYVLLTSLQPFMQIEKAADTAVAFDLRPHRGSREHHNVLFADGHVEGIPAEDLPGLIGKSLLAPRRETSSNTAGDGR